MGKKKIKLNKEQKVWYNNLQWYLANKVVWRSEQNIKEVVLDGKYAVISGTMYEFDSVVCCPDREGAMAVMLHHPAEFSMIVTLDFLMELREYMRIMQPNFDNYIEMLNDEKCP